MTDDERVIAAVVDGVAVALEPGETALDQGHAVGALGPVKRVEISALLGKVHADGLLGVRQHVDREMLGVVKRLEPARGFGGRPEHERRVQ